MGSTFHYPASSIKWWTEKNMGQAHRCILATMAPLVHFFPETAYRGKDGRQLASAVTKDRALTLPSFRRVRTGARETGPIQRAVGMGTAGRQVPCWNTCSVPLWTATFRFGGSESQVPARVRPGSGSTLNSANAYFVVNINTHPL